MTDINKKNKKYSPAARREMRRCKRRKIVFVLVLTGATILLQALVTLGFMTIVNYNQRSAFDTEVRAVCNDMYKSLKQGDSDEQVRNAIEGVIRNANTPNFVTKIYRYENGVDIINNDETYDEEAMDDTVDNDWDEEDYTANDKSMDSDVDESAEYVSDGCAPGDTFVENGITYRWISTDEGIIAVRVQNDDTVYEDTRSAMDIYRDRLINGPEDTDITKVENYYERSRQYLDSVFERVGMNMYSEYEEFSFVSRYFYKSRTLSVGGRDYYVTAAMYADPFEDINIGVIWISMGISIFLIIFYVVAAILSYRKNKREIFADETRRNMIAAIAHDVRGPVTAISGYAENLQQIARDAESRHYTASILDNVSYINEMITGMLSYMRLEKTMTIKKKSVDVEKIAGQVIDRYRGEFENRNIECELSGHAVVRADSRLVELLIDNLIMNIAKYAADDSNAYVTIEDGQITFTNKMACDIECDPTELWEPMKKGNSARTGHTGNGLGLSIVKKILDLSGFTGEIKVEEETFVVTIRF